MTTSAFRLLLTLLLTLGIFTPEGIKKFKKIIIINFDYFKLPPECICLVQQLILNQTVSFLLRVIFY